MGKVCSWDFHMLWYAKWLLAAGISYSYWT